MYLFQKRLMKLTQSAQQPIRLQSRYYSHQKENSAPPPQNIKPINLIKKLNEVAPIKINPKKIITPISKTISKDSKEIWHKRSMSMQVKNANFKDGRKMISGQLIKYRKGQEIFAFRCIKETQIKHRQLKSLKQDHDTETDDEQVFAASKNMFMSLCQSLKEEIFNSQAETPELKVFLDDDFM